MNNKIESHYFEQFQRMIRWYISFEEINNGIIHNKDSDYYLDIVYAFFINCYHLKDWIKNDNNISKKLKKVEDYVKKDKFLLICGDICNGIKHLKLDVPKIGDSGANISHKHINLSLGNENPIIKINYIISGDDKDWNAFDVATEAKIAWEIFLNKNDIEVVL